MKFLRGIYDAMFAPAGTFDQDSGLWDASNDSVHVPDMSVINPATNLPMTDGYASVDVGGSPFGLDVHSHSDSMFEDYSQPAFDDSSSMFD